MAERTSPVNGLYVDLVKYLTQLGTPGNAAFGYLAFDEASMAGLTEASTALTTESTKSGLARANGTVTRETTTVTYDTFKTTKQFTAGESATLYGAACFNASSGPLMGAFHEWAASLPLVSGDKITETITIQVKKA
jgi:hypothetical protein